MSSDLRSLRDIPNDPFGKFLNLLSRKFSAFANKDQAEQVENPEDIYSDGQDVDSVIKYHNFAMTKRFPLNVDYSSASEPDGDKVTLFLGMLFQNLGNTMTDTSGFNNHATIYGDPILVDGNFDLGIVEGASNTKSTAVRFNRPTSTLVNREYMAIPHNDNLKVESVATGISFFLRFRISDLTSQNGAARRLFEKTDGPTPDHGYMVQVDSSGRLIFIIKRAGVEYKKQTATSTIAINTLYDCFFTYAVSGNTIHIWVNNSDKSVTDFGTVNWRSDPSERSLTIFTRGIGATSGNTYGDFYHMVVYREKVVSSTEIGQHFTNKITLANIPFGQVAVTNYGASQ